MEFVETNLTAIQQVINATDCYVEWIDWIGSLYVAHSRCSEGRFIDIYADIGDMTQSQKWGTFCTNKSVIELDSFIFYKNSNLECNIHMYILQYKCCLTLALGRIIKVVGSISPSLFLLACPVGVEVLGLPVFSSVLFLFPRSTTYLLSSWQKPFSMLSNSQCRDTQYTFHLRANSYFWPEKNTKTLQNLWI